MNAIALSLALGLTVAAGAPQPDRAVRETNPVPSAQPEVQPDLPRAARLSTFRPIERQERQGSWPNFLLPLTAVESVTVRPRFEPLAPAAAVLVPRQAASPVPPVPLRDTSE